MKKITIKDFWNNDKKIAIHCNTEEKANELCKTLDKNGMSWLRGLGSDRYIDFNGWFRYQERTCYSNAGGYGSINFYIEEEAKIYEFEDVDLGA